MDKIRVKLNYFTKKLNEHIKNYFLNINGIEKTLFEAMEYSINSGGKRLRPCVLLLFYEILGGKAEEIYNIAMALEMIHTYSLIHDDLPCMDNDNMRRGKKCTHIVYGEDMALLAGDALITQAFEVLLSDNNVKLFGEKAIIKSSRELAKAAGSRGMVAGQVIDINMDSYHDIDEKLVLNMYKNKTGALFSVAARMGAICADANENQVKLCGEYGENLGIAFQLYDDIMDVSQDENKITYVSLFGKEKAINMANYYTDKSIENIKEFKEKGLILSDLPKLLSARKT